MLVIYGGPVEYLYFKNALFGTSPLCHHSIGLISVHNQSMCLMKGPTTLQKFSYAKS